MDLKNLKIKYILGSFKDDPSFPTIEDFEYFYLTWVDEPYQKEYLEQRRESEKDPEGHYFTYNFLLACLNNEKEKTDEFLDKLIESGNVSLPKRKLYKILKFEY